MFNAEWCDVIKALPEQDGEYYIFAVNKHDGNFEIFPCFYIDKTWDLKLGNGRNIVGWKKILSKQVDNKEKWLKEHEQEICEKYHLDSIETGDFCVVETIEECFIHYEFWIYEEKIKYIDGLYVIQVLF